MNQFERLKQISPYSVITEYVEGYDGGFWFGSNTGHKPYEEKDFVPHISISPNIKLNTQRVSTLIHEIGHAIHYKRHCKCYTTNRDLTEYHAEKFTLQFMLRYKLKGALRYEIKYLIRYRHHPNSFFVAARRIMKSKLWKKCLDYING